MSYCVNCGVELQKSEPRCPLCGTEVINPNEIVQEERPIRPYPSHVEHLDKSVDRRYIASFISLLLLIPLFTVMLANILVSKQLTWSYYVLGGELVIFTVLLLPMIARMPKVLYVVIDAAAVGVLLLLIQIIAQGDWGWLLLLALPITGVAALMCWFFTMLASPKCRLPILVRFSFALACVGLFVVAIEFFIGLYRHAIAWPTWSLYVLFPCLVLASSLLILNRRARVKEEIRKRFYY
ncbi:hypothetical protein SDC9_116146 [bioreactor metagenome]|uniref:Uncharacterized protein n=1 Tax=bioreactor metagenome TaxID=1076179 RepID=A0A645BVC7_9ZZZZ